MPQYKLSKKDIKEAVENCNGTYLDLGRQLGMNNGVTAKKHLYKYPDLVKLFETHQKELMNIAEDTLMQCLESESDAVRSSTAQFVLKNLTVAKEKWGATTDNTETKLVDLIEKLIINAEKDD